MFSTADLPPVESLATQEGPARFHALMLDIILVLAEVRCLTIVLEGERARDVSRRTGMSETS